MTGIVPSFLPAPIFWVYLTGLCLVAAGISIVSGRYTQLACQGLAALLGLFVLTVHLPLVLCPDTLQLGMPGLLKDLGLMGGGLFMSENRNPK